MGEEKNDNSKDFGHVIDALHNKQKLSSLRTYQGDMAEFIKRKNESTISIATKEKERNQQREEEKIKQEKQEKKLTSVKKQASSGEGFKMNFVALILGIVLLAAGGMAVLYSIDFAKKEPIAAPFVGEEKLIPYNNMVTLANVNKNNFGQELGKLSLAGGINVVKVSDSNGSLIKNSKEFLRFIGATLPPALERTLKDDFVIGVFSQSGQTYPFIVIAANDFGQAFSGMLSWEVDMEKDLAFFNPGKDLPVISIVVATSTATTTKNITASTTVKKVSTTTPINSEQSAVVKIPMKPEIFKWQDLIVKNKDTRGLANDKRQAKIAYTFLDKNTILITNNLSIIGEISSAFASRSVAR